MTGGGHGQLEGDRLALAVSDAYEDLPAKSLALLRWVVEQTDFEHLLKIDDDCHLAAARLVETLSHARSHYRGRALRRGAGDTQRTWHQRRASTLRGRTAIDKSPEPSTYADGAGAYVLSRYAMRAALGAMRSPEGARLAHGAFFEDKLLGDLLALARIEVDPLDHPCYIRRRFGDTAVTVGADDNTSIPGRSARRS